ncbi:MAG: response regulator [Planctomycetes bacterium]|nr:response regulator [Planctomycetota bacterium]
MHARNLAILLFALLAAPRLAAQHYFTQIYGLREGLPSAEVASLAQDAEGRIWLATRIGLVAFDGQTWEAENPERNVSGVTNALVRSDTRGRIWTANDSAVYRHEAQGWVAFPAFAPRIKPTTDVPIELFLLELDGETRPILIFASGRIEICLDERWQPIAFGDDDDERKIGAAALHRGRLLVATDRDLRLVDPVSREVTTITGEGSADLVALASVADRNEVWAVGRGHLGRIRFDDTTGPGRFETEGPRFVEESLALRWKPGRAASDGHGGLYFGDSAVVAHYDPASGIEFLERANGLISGGVHDVILDREGNVWIATSRGLTKIISRRIAGFDAEHGLLEDEVTAIVETPGGMLVLGHNSCGLTILDGREVRRLRLAPAGRHGRIMDLALDRDGSIWVASESVGLFHVPPEALSRDQRGDGIRKVPLEIPRDSFNTVEFDAQGRLWAGMASGLYRIENEQLVPMAVTTTAVPGQIRRLALGASGRLYATSVAGGLILIDGDRTTAIIDPPDLRSTYSVVERRDGSVMVGTREGLCRLEGERLEICTEPRIARPVYGLVEDSRHRLWVGTDNGVYICDGDRIEHVGSENGLFGLEVNRAAAVVDGRDRVWIGTDRGVSVFHPGEEHRRSSGPSVTFTGIEASGEPQDINADIVLEQPANDLAFRFRAISFIDEDRVRFRLRLEGLEEDFGEARLVPLREVLYQNIPSGRYRLHLVPIDVEGRAGPEVVSPWIEVLPLFWQQSWFVVLLILVIAGLGAVVYALFQQRRMRHALEAEVRERTADLERAAEAQERITRLDALGVLAGGIAHDFNNLLTAIGGNIDLIAADPGLNRDSRQLIDLSDKACGKARNLTQQLLTFSRGGAPLREVSEIAAVIRDSVEFSMRGSGVECRLQIAGDLPLVHIDVGQFHQVFSNILINARQAMAERGHLEVIAQRVADPEAKMGEAVEIRIVDDGPGIRTEVLPRIFDPYFSTKDEGNGLGLSIAHSIVQRHGGTIGVESEYGRGATFRIRLPATSDSKTDESEPAEAVARFEGRILLMDDQETVRSFARRVLERFGCSVVECADGDRAIAAFRQALEEGRPFAAVILDLTVPGGMGGLEASRQLLQLDPSARIIVTSGYSKDETFARHEDHGFRARLPKPFSSDDLSRALARALR